MSKNRTNVLLITSDQQHWYTLGFLNPQVKTPNLDRLAAMGCYYDRAYTVNPTCTPTRASIITGQYPSQHGAYALGTKLLENVHTVGEDFHQAGYQTALIGKAHFQPLKGTSEFPSIEAYPVLQDFDFWRKYKGPFYGFRHFELARNHTDEAHVGQHYALWMEEQGATNWRDYFCQPTGTHEKQQWRWNIPEELHYNTWIAERSNALLDEYAANDAPFFLWASFFDPHPSYLVPEPWASMYDPNEMVLPSLTKGEHDKNPPHFGLTQQPVFPKENYTETDGNIIHGFHPHGRNEEVMRKNLAVYYGMISCMDKYMGQILDRLEKLGLAENTLVVFTTDHGHVFGQHGLNAKGPFHYEDLIKIPWIVRTPGQKRGVGFNSAIQSIADLAPTMLDYCGIDIPRCMTGRSQKPVWDGVVDAVRDHAMIEDRFNPTKMHLKSYVNERYKITVYYDADYGELFDLTEDPGELNNLWSAPACLELKQQLLLKLIQAQLGMEPMLMPRIAPA